MKQSTKNKAKGKAHELRGKVKEKVGRVTKNPRLQAEGRAEEVAGKIQQKVGGAEKVLED
jgi:uncharacterized protein YjbJ (UPF0337 family)